MTRGTFNAEFDGKKISVAEISAEADCADMNAIPAKVSAKTLGANVTASGTVSKKQQVINAEVDAINFDKILPYLPADKIPDGVEILGGAAEKFSIHVLHNEDTLSYLGSTNFKNAAVKVEQTNVENINGSVTFNEREIFLDASAVANGQHASASGKIRLDTDETFFDIYPPRLSTTSASTARLPFVRTWSAPRKIRKSTQKFIPIISLTKIFPRKIFQPSSATSAK